MQVKSVRELGGKWFLNAKKTDIQRTFLNSGDEEVV